MNLIEEDKTNPNDEKPNKLIKPQNCDKKLEDHWHESFISIPIDKPQTVKRNLIEKNKISNEADKVAHQLQSMEEKKEVLHKDSTKEVSLKIDSCMAQNAQPEFNIHVISDKSSEGERAQNSIDDALDENRRDDDRFEGVLRPIDSSMSLKEPIGRIDRLEKCEQEQSRLVQSQEVYFTRKFEEPAESFDVD